MSIKNCILNKRIKNGNTVKRDVTICNKYDEKTMHIKNGIELCNTKWMSKTWQCEIWLI